MWHLIIEVGVSEKLPQPHCDAAWWLENSGGNVNTVLLISVEQEKRILLQKWEMGDIPNPRFTRRRLWETVRIQKYTPELENVGHTAGHW